jgi:preprotein translocase subunit SecE
MAITDYINNVRAEMKHVSWPSRQLTIIYTAVVVGISLAVAFYLGVFDYLFSSIIKTIIK